MGREFLRGIRRKFLPGRVGRLRLEFPGKLWVALDPWQSLGGVPEVSLPWQGWHERRLKVPPNPQHSTIPEFVIFS